MDPPAEEITDQPRRKNVQANTDYSMGRKVHSSLAPCHPMPSGRSVGWTGYTERDVQSTTPPEMRRHTSAQWLPRSNHCGEEESGRVVRPMVRWLVPKASIVKGKSHEK